MSDISIFYTYDRRGSGPSTAANGTLSNHHVLSYPHMYALGAIVLTHASLNETFKNTCNNAFQNYYGHSVPELTKDNLPKQIESGKMQITSGSDQILSAIAWTHDNLFVGPAGKYREDDPSQRTDGKPISAGEWPFPDAMNSLFNSFNSRVANRAGDSVSIKIQSTKIEDIANAFIGAIFGRKQPPPKESKVSDWVVEPFDLHGVSKRLGYCLICFPDSPGGGIDFDHPTEYSNRELCYGRLSLRKGNGMHVTTNKRFCICARKDGAVSRLYGELVNVGKTRIGQDDGFIRNYFASVP